LAIGRSQHPPATSGEGVGPTPEWGTLSNPQKRDFRWSFTQALEIASFLSCTRLNTMVGNRVRGIGRDIQMGCAAENLSWAVPLAEQGGVTLLIEPLNETNFPDCVLHRTGEAVRIIRQVGHSAVSLQYEIYHAQMTEGNLIDTITNCLPNIGRIQTADVSGRHQPGTGKINYSAVIEVVKKPNYSGCVGLEYRPSNDSDSSPAWLPSDDRGHKPGGPE
jgi:hydroxypyruvate isomerase